MVAWNDKHGDATERRSAYAKASAYAEATADKSEDKYDPPSLLRASAYALCAMADKTEDKLRKSSGWNRLRRGFGLR